MNEESAWTETTTTPMALFEGYDQSPSIAALVAALSKAQGMIKGAAKDSTNPFFKNKYADLSSVWEACREALSKNELAVIQTPVEGGVITMLAHSSGEWIKSYLPMKPTKDDAQGAGSAITYARRYALAAFVGVAPEDDDGQAASTTPKATVIIPAKVKNAVVDQSRACLEKGDEHGLKEVWAEFGNDEKVVLWGLFNSQERASMKKLMG